MLIAHEAATTKELQLVCVSVLHMCRVLPSLKVTVNRVKQLAHLRVPGADNKESEAVTSRSSTAGDATPAGPLARPKRSTAGKTSKRKNGFKKAWGGTMQAIVHLILPRNLVWQLPSAKLRTVDVTALRCLQLGYKNFRMDGFNESLDSLAWPPLLQVLILGFRFNQPLQGTTFPDTLKELRIGGMFNHNIDGVIWPAKLETLVFDRVHSQFNTPTKTWPASLNQLILGRAFNRDLSGLPYGLQVLELGIHFNANIAAIGYRTSLRRLRFGHYFNKPIDGIVWPASLREIRFRGCFNQPLTAVTWPASLKKLHFGSGFEQPVEEVSWAASVVVMVLKTRIWPKKR